MKPTKTQKTLNSNHQLHNVQSKPSQEEANNNKKTPNLTSIGVSLTMPVENAAEEDREAAAPATAGRTAENIRNG